MLSSSSLHDCCISNSCSMMSGSLLHGPKAQHANPGTMLEGVAARAQLTRSPAASLRSPSNRGIAAHAIADTAAGRSGPSPASSPRSTASLASSRVLLGGKTRTAWVLELRAQGESSAGDGAVSRLVTLDCSRALCGRSVLGASEWSKSIQSEINWSDLIGNLTRHRRSLAIRTRCDWLQE